MLQRVFLAVILAGVMVWTFTCGRSRAPQPSDTPVPTFTPLPVVAATDTVAPSPTEPPAETPTEAPTETEMPTQTATRIVSTGQVTATAEIGETDELTTSDSLTETERVTGPATITGPATVTESAAVAGSMGVTDTATGAEQATLTRTVAVTGSSQVTESAGVRETPAATQPSSIAGTDEATASPEDSTIAQATTTPQPSSTPAASTTGASTPQPQTTATATPLNTPSSVPTASPTRTSLSTATVTSSATVTPSATTTPSATDTPPATVTVSRTPTPTVAATATVTPSVTATSVTTETRKREVIALPDNLATSVQVNQVTLLTDLVADALPMVAELSPDGSTVAWLVPEQARRAATLCIAKIDGRGQNCFSAAGYQGMPYRLVWSPDNRWLAFSEDSAAQALESDIWLFDVKNGELVNRSDDQATGRYVEIEENFALDYLPMWDPATGYLYFWRSTMEREGSFDLDLMRLDPDKEGVPETVRSFERSLGDGLLRFGWQRYYLHGPSTISPDGSQMAVAVAPSQEMDVSSGHALWLINLVETDREPQPLTTALAWQAALPRWSNQPAVARGLQWTGDGRGIVVAALSSDLRLPLLMAYYVDVASGDVVPVVDFSDSRDRDAFFRLDPATGHARRFDVPWTMALVPETNVLLMVTDLAGGVRILAAPLPPTGSSPMVLREHRSPGYEAWTRSSAGGGRVLVYGMVLEVAPVK